MLFQEVTESNRIMTRRKKSIGYLEEAQAIFLVGDAWAYLGFGFYLTGELVLQRNICFDLFGEMDAFFAM